MFPLILTALQRDYNRGGGVCYSRYNKGTHPKWRVSREGSNCVAKRLYYSLRSGLRAKTLNPKP